MKDSELYLKMFKEFGVKLGATGEFPEGKLTPNDEGEIKIAVGIEQNKVVIHFGKEIAWIGFGRSEAIRIASSLIDMAAKIK
jgi:hypothetical protein